jgi:NAD(P)-dependent dehydrogenase (short-subunit alcohol dehydrogenase family)
VEKWEQLWEINIRGVLLCYKYAARQMVKQGAGGRIIGILFVSHCFHASELFARRFFNVWIVRCASKLHLDGLSKPVSQDTQT